MIEIFKHANYDFFSKKWFFIGFSWFLIMAGVLSVCLRLFDGKDYTHPFNMGVDFAGGTLATVRFREKPDFNRLRQALEQQGIEGTKISLQPVGDQIGQAPSNEVLVRLPNLVNTGQHEAQSAESTSGTDLGKGKVLAALRT